MPTIPRALVISPVLDGKAFAAVLDKVLTGFTSSQISAQLTNTATVVRAARSWLLFPFLDRGTKPHYIGDGSEKLANLVKGFGPVWGPVFHPGTRPYDITARVATYLQARLQQQVSFPLLHFAGISSSSTDLPWDKLSNVLVAVLTDSLNFARTITPDNWAYVKASYKLVINTGSKIFRN